MTGFVGMGALTIVLTNGQSIDRGAPMLVGAPLSWKPYVPCRSLYRLKQGKDNRHANARDAYSEGQPRLLILVLNKEGFDCGRKD